MAAAYKLLEIPEELIENALIELQVFKDIYQEKLEGVDVVYLSSFYYKEINVARRLLDLSSMKQEINSKEIEERIERLEKQKDIKLADEQKEAIKQAMGEGVLIITGGPGTGKTTTINIIISLLEEEGLMSFWQHLREEQLSG